MYITPLGYLFTEDPSNAFSYLDNACGNWNLL